MTAPFTYEKNKVRFSSSWLSVYIKDADLQSIPMTIGGENGCHWLSEKCMTTNDNENTVGRQKNSLNIRKLTNH